MEAQALIIAVLAADIATNDGVAADVLLRGVLPNVSDREKLRLHDAIGAAVIVAREMLEANEKG